MCSTPPYDTSPAPCVLVINTGGTFGMKKRDRVLVPGGHADLMDHLRLSRIFGTFDARSRTFTLSPIDDIKGGNRDRSVHYTVTSLNPLLDSSNMTPAGWNSIANCIKQNYRQYIGFVVIHGTDTMVYTASVLSFMFENLGKPVVITGAQKPIFDFRTDAGNNLINSIIVAGTLKIPEVLLCFGNKVFRGNRCVKIDCSGFDAFDSPNHPPLVEFGVQINAKCKVPQRQQNWSDSLTVVQIREGGLPVGILRLHPGITPERVKNTLKGMKAVVLQSFGAGNAPGEDWFETALENFTSKKKGGIIINVTQCLKGTVTSDYASGGLEKYGVIPGADMTEEAAFCKLCYMLSRGDRRTNQWFEDLKRPIRQEMTPLQEY